jgi:hypothetical protein
MQGDVLWIREGIEHCADEVQKLRAICEDFFSWPKLGSGQDVLRLGQCARYERTDRWHEEPGCNAPKYKLKSRSRVIWVSVSVPNWTGMPLKSGCA